MQPSDDMLRGLLSAAPDALVAVDPAGRILYANDQAERLFDWKKSELIGQSVDLLIPERLRTDHPALRANYIAHPTTRPMGPGLDLWACRRDGSEFPAQISLSSITTPDGIVVAAAIRDATTTRNAAQRWRDVLDAAPDAGVGVDVSGRIGLVNAQAERLFGWSADELLGAQIEILVPGDIDAKHVRHRANYVRGPRPRPMGAGLQLSALRKDGSTFPAEISLNTVTDEFGELMVLASVRDITERIEMEAERQRQALAEHREQSDRLESLGQLAGGVAHDFNNLLGVILNYATLLTRQATDATMVNDLNEIREAAQRGARLTSQLLTFARRGVANRGPLDIAAVVTSIASMLERTLGEHIELRLVVDGGPVMALCDRTQVEQIVMNLALNARDAMPTGGVLTISARMAGGDTPFAVLSVEDTGHGMSPEVKARAFEPFFSTKQAGSGTGLGLATVYGIVAQNNGEIEIDTAASGGTMMWVRLPAAPAHAADPAATTTSLPSGGHERILLVEDEATLRTGTLRILTDAGYHVTEAANGAEALDAILTRRVEVDIVVTDVSMPQMRGDELVTQLRHRGIGTPIVFLTGYDSGGVSPTLGRVLAKPVAEEDLLRIIREVLDE